jgi:hypothetical protein
LLAAGHRLHESIGGKPRPVPAHGRDRSQCILLLRVPCRGSQRPRGRSASAAEGPSGNSVGAIGWSRALPPASAQGGTPGVGPASAAAPPPRTTLPFGARGRLSSGRPASRPPGTQPGRAHGGAAAVRRSHDSYLVDSASSHMLVSKIKPCMSKYKQLYCETANGSLNQLSFI